MVRATGLVLLALAACQGNREAPAGDEPTPKDDAPIAVAADAREATPDAVKLDEPEPVPEPNKLIAELGAIPAWQAVIDRAQLLARRGQRGVVYGRIGPALLVPGPVSTDPLDAGVRPIDAGLVPSPYVWLVDDTEGNGALGIRVALGGKTATAGDRVALGGAWQLDEARRWYWRVETLQVLPPAPPSDVKDPPWPEPTHAIPNGNLPPGARTITVARDHDAVYFQIVGPAPANDGDGWAVADELGDKVFALLVLPGERASYGGQDMRAPDERWQLKKAQTYWVRIGKIRSRGPDKPAVIHARTGPVRVN